MYQKKSVATCECGWRICIKRLQIPSIIFQNKVLTYSHISTIQVGLDQWSPVLRINESPNLLH